MNNPCLLVKTAPELYIKSDFVNTEMTRLLVRNIQTAFFNRGIFGAMFRIQKGRVQVFGPELQQMVPVLKTVFGVHAVALAEFFSATDFETVVQKTVDWAKQNIRSGDSFAVDCSRSGNQSFSSKDVEIKAGSLILQAIPKTSVNLTHPKKTVFVNVLSNGFFLYSDVEKGPNGLPVGCQGTIGFLLAGKKGEDKAVWLLLRRGCSVVPIVSKKFSPSFLKKLQKWNHFQPFQTIQKKELAEKKQKLQLLALATADQPISASELKKMQQSDLEFDWPVLRPLLGFDFKLLNVKL